MTQPPDDAALVARPGYVSDDTVVEVASRWDDGVSGTHLVARLVNGGVERLEAQRAVQRVLDRGKLRLGRGLRIFPPRADRAKGEVLPDSVPQA